MYEKYVKEFKKECNIYEEVVPQMWMTNTHNVLENLEGPGTK